jgi:hypothetical protein
MVGECCIIQPDRLRGGELTRVAVSLHPSVASDAQAILRDLQRVAAERGARTSDASLHARVQAIKRYQHRRFALTYDDLLKDPRYEGAARFFLEELYGPGDFSKRDAQFERVVPTLVRLFSREIVSTVGALARLHALSESLDTEMGRHLDPGDGRVTAAAYVRAWQKTGRADERAAQIDLMLEIGTALDRYTRRPMLRHSLRLLRGPATATGLSDLQRFLETGFDIFRSMRGAPTFLSTIESRERALGTTLFSAKGIAAEYNDPAYNAEGQLPRSV